ncbi:unnamed protein product [Polarella glacialis]|uniref:Uncharacterized protein n=1 Tax=Polarella glacialis TaxID=89957 RepID=A0A813G614_POLGL|nr:unnamed protein product [Polarella glacialis]
MPTQGVACPGDELANCSSCSAGYEPNVDVDVDSTKWRVPAKCHIVSEVNFQTRGMDFQHSTCTKQFWDRPAWDSGDTCAINCLSLALPMWPRVVSPCPACAAT